VGLGRRACHTVGAGRAGSWVHPAPGRGGVGQPRMLCAWCIVRGAKIVIVIVILRVRAVRGEGRYTHYSWLRK